MHTEGRESELLIALAQTRNELARERENRWELEKERGEMNAALKAELREHELTQEALGAAFEDLRAADKRAIAAESERDALRGEVKRLRDVLKALLAFPGSNATDHEKCDEECPYERARTALAGGGDRG